MSNQTRSTVKLVQVSLLIAIMVVMAMVPFLGYIPLTPTIRATTIHIPVIIGAILLGPRVGALLGFVFGLTSLITNTINGGVTAFVFLSLIHILKYAVSLVLGVCDMPAAPFEPLSSAQKEQVRTILNQAGILPAE